MHVRQQIRNLFLTRLLDNTGADDRVYTSRVYPIAKFNSPAIIIYSTTETAEAATIGNPGSTIRELTVNVEIYIKGVLNLDNDLDAIAAQVEKLLTSECGFIGNISAINYDGFETEYNGEGDNAFLVGTLEYSVTYWVNNDDPENEG